MGSEDKLDAIVAKGLDLREIIRDTGHDIGVLRLISLRDGLNLTFDGLRYGFIHKNTLAVNISDMIDEVYNRSAQRCEDKEKIASAILKCKEMEYDIWHICSGHDLTAILGKALLSLFGTNSTQAVRRAEIESKLRMAFSLDDLRRTKLFIAVLGWERANKPFLVWREAFRLEPLSAIEAP